MKPKKNFSLLFFNGLFLLITATGMISIYFTRIPGSEWVSGIWALWIAVNYVFLIRVKLCRYCSYYGGNCPMGWGYLVPFLVSKGETAKFSTRKWPLVYFFSLAVFPPSLVVISLIYYWDQLLLALLALFIFQGLLLGGLVRITCCVHCDMKPACLLSKVTPRL